MKIIIMSDSHLKNETVLNIIDAHQEADYFIHCGDLGQEIQVPSQYPFYAVKGNNDFISLPKELNLTIENRTFFITHGDQYLVDSSLAMLSDLALNNHYDYVLYGHTHNPKVDKINNTYFINPGSVTFPRGGRIFVPTYCMLENESIHFYHAKTHESVDHLFEPKKRTSFFKKFFTKR